MQIFISTVLNFSSAWWLVVAISFFTSFYMSRAVIIDHPNERSLHKKPIPRGGGIAFVLPIFLLYIVLSIYDPFVFFTFLPAFLLAAIGFWDDCSNLGWKKRFFIQCICSIWVSAIIVFFMGSSCSLGLAGKICLFVVGVFWLISLANIYNFMDGIDGNASIEAIMVCLFFMVVAMQVHSFIAYSFTYYILFGVAIFLAFNFPKARLFMGDVGSQFLGFIFGLLGLLTAVINWDYFFAMPLLLFNFIFDAGWTILKRFRKGENIFQAHQTHLYQKLVIYGYKHWQISLLTGLFVLFQGGLFMFGAFFLHLKSWQGIILFIPAIMVQLIYAFYVAHKTKE